MCVVVGIMKQKENREIANATGIVISKAFDDDNAIKCMYIYVCVRDERMPLNSNE